MATTPSTPNLANPLTPNTPDPQAANSPLPQNPVAAEPVVPTAAAVADQLVTASPAVTDPAISAMPSHSQVQDNISTNLNNATNIAAPVGVQPQDSVAQPSTEPGMSMPATDPITAVANNSATQNDPLDITAGPATAADVSSLAQPLTTNTAAPTAVNEPAMVPAPAAPVEPAAEPASTPVDVTDLGYNLSTAATPAPAEPAINAGTVTATVTDEVAAAAPVMEVPPVSPVADQSNSVPTQLPPADTTSGIVETPGPALNVPAAELPAAETTTTQAMPETIPPADTGAALPPLAPAATPPADTMPTSKNGLLPDQPQQMNKSVDVLGGLPPLDNNVVAPEPAKSGGRGGTLLFIGLIFVVGIVLFIVGIMLASGGSLPIG